MKQKFFSLGTALALLAVVSACAKAPAAPTTTTGSSSPTTATSSTDSATGVTLVSPTLVSPASLAQIPNIQQPVTLVINNGLSTGKSTPTYTFEVASDSAFSTKVYVKDGVAQGANGQTSLTIDKIGAGKNYFWRARTNSGSAAGLYSSVRGFTIGPEVILQTPVLGDPAPNASVDVQPTLNVNNVQRTGPAGKITYKFDVATQSNFGQIVYSANVAERTDLSFTPHTVTTPLPEGTLWWRVQATDSASGVTSPSSIGSPFVAKKIPPFDMRNASIYNSPPDLGSWAETSKITSIEFTDSAMLVDFDKRTGPNAWPDVPFGAGALEYTLGMCLFINNHWDCSAVVQFWNGRELEASGVPAHFNFEWFYDPARWGPMTGYQPSAGEIIGVFAAAGDLRNNTYTLATCPRVCERTNVALIPYPGDFNSKSFTFSTGTAIKFHQ
jgi:hypothetical protein